MAKCIVCPNCEFREGPFHFYRHVAIVRADGDTQAPPPFPQDDVIRCPSCGIVESLEVFTREG